MSSDRAGAKNHTWQAVGIDPQTFEPNIWKCYRCGMIRAVGRREGSRANAGLLVEYSSDEGDVIQEGLSPVPPCNRKDD